MWRDLAARWGADVLSPAAHQVAARIVAGKAAWTHVGRLRRIALAELEAARMVERWALKTGTYATFTPLGARRYGLVLVEWGPEDVPRWSLQGEDEDGPLPPRARSRLGSLDRPELVEAPKEYLADSETGATTDDPDEAVRVMGVPVRPLRPRKASGTDRSRTRGKPGKSTRGRSTHK